MAAPRRHRWAGVRAQQGAPAPPEMRPGHYARVAGPAVALLALALTWRTGQFGGWFVTGTVSNLAAVATAFAATAGCWHAAHREAGCTRRAWLLIGWGTAAWGLGQAVWSFSEIVLRVEVPFPSVADIGFLGLIPLAGGGLVAFLGGTSGRPINAARTVLDGLLIAVSLLFVSWATVLAPAYRAHSGSALEGVLLLAYPVGDTALLSIVIFVLAKAPRGGRFPLGLLATGLVAISLSDSLFMALVLMDRYHSGHLIDIGWMAGFLLIGLAGFKHRPAPPEPATPSPELSVGSLVLPYAPLALACGVAASDMSDRGGLHPFSSWSITVLLLLVIIRQVLALADNLARTRELAERTAEMAARERRFRALVQHSSDVITLVDADSTVRYVSPSVARVLGYAAGELEGIPLASIAHPDDAPGLLALLGTNGAHPESQFLEWRCRHRDGGWVHAATLANDLSGDNDVAGIVLNTRDVTERKEIEARLHQSERLESLGQLACGVAHDFNNLLTVILGSVSFLLEDLPLAQPGRPVSAPAPLRVEIEAIQRSAERAAELTGRLLAFGRRQFVQPRLLDLSAVSAEVESLLRSMAGEGIALEMLMADDLSPISADPGQIEQILANLVGNARDAMPTGGTVLVEASNTEIDENWAAQCDVDPGRYVCLSVTDTGLGMPKEVAERAFDPFFTTKDPGSGTGLGLATVYGIVRQAGGQVLIYSKVGEGTIVDLYLPASEGDTLDLRPSLAEPRAGGGEAILIVEDEPGVRETARRILARHGYRVSVARDQHDALRLCSSLPPVDVLLTDLIMPGMNGLELARRATEARPGLRVAFMSGHPWGLVGIDHELPSGTCLVAKPFSRIRLLDAVSNLLEREAVS